MKLKRIFAAVTAFALCASLAGCGAATTVSESTAESAAESAVEAAPAVTEAPATEETADASEAALRIAGLKGPTTMGLVNLMSDEVASNYNFTMYGAADEIVPLLVKGDLDAAAVPANLAATLYNKTNGAVEVACINTLGVLYIVENGETVNSVGDLKGQTIVTTGKGATPEYVLRYVLTENGVDPDSDVTIEYCSEATEALSKVQAGEATIAMLPQPFVTSAMSQVEGLRVALDMNELRTTLRLLPPSWMAMPPASRPQTLTSRAPQPSASSTALSPRLHWPRRLCRSATLFLRPATR